MNTQDAKQSLVKIPGGRTSCEYAFYPGLELCAYKPEHVILSYEAIVQQKPDTAIFITGKSADTIQEYWESIGKPIMIFANSADMQFIKSAFSEIPTVSIYEKFAEWNIFGSCVHDGYNMPPHEKNTDNAVRGLLETMGASINTDSHDNSLPILTYDISERNSLLSKGMDAYFVLELFFDENPDDESAHDHENHTPKPLRTPQECKSMLVSVQEQSQNISDVKETILNLFF